MTQVHETYVTKPVTVITANSKSSKRFKFIDALRGIAAFGVLFHHMLHNSVMEVTLRHILPIPLQTLSHYGACGVQIFFVISGFVIAHSIRNLALTREGIANFILRRQLRLDPPYWTLILLTLFEQRIERMVPYFKRPPMPGIVDVMANAVYLPKILHRELIVGVAWTLCLEVQFYLIFILLVAAGQYNTGKRLTNGLTRFTVIATVASGLISLLTTYKTSAGPWFITYWFYFVSGVLVYWAIRNEIRKPTAIVFLCAVGTVGLHQNSPQILFGMATAVALYWAGTLNHLTDWLDNRVLQYLGLYFPVNIGRHSFP